MVAKGYTEPVKDRDHLFASTPLFCTLRILLTNTTSQSAQEMSVLHFATQKQSPTTW